MRPYNRILASSSYYHCSWMDYSGGWTPGMAPHIIDLPIWALDLKYPLRVHCSGGRYIIRDDGDAPDVQEILWQYPNLTMTWMCNLVNSYGFDLHGNPVPQRRLGIYFHGVDGTLYANYTMHQVVPEGDRMKDREPPPASIPPSPGHELEWINCVKTREQPSCSVFYHVRVDVPIVLGNLAYRLGRSLTFDPDSEQIVGDEEAARLDVPAFPGGVSEGIAYRVPEWVPVPSDGNRSGVRLKRFARRRNSLKCDKREGGAFGFCRPFCRSYTPHTSDAFSHLTLSHFPPVHLTS